MFNFLKKSSGSIDEKEQAKNQYEKVISITTDSHEARKIKLGMSMLCQAHLNSTFISGAEQTALYTEAVMAAVINGEEKPNQPQYQEYVKIKRGENFIWTYLPAEFAEKAFLFGSQYQLTKINASQAIESMQGLADQLCYCELKLDFSFVALQFLRDEIAIKTSCDIDDSAE